MGACSDGAPSRSHDDSLASEQYPTTRLLVAAIHKGNVDAIQSLFLLYAPLLRDQARKLSVPPGEIDEFVVTFLDDIVLHIMEVNLIPHDFTRYLVSALRNRARNRRRDELRRHASEEKAYVEQGTTTERIVAECHSQYGLQSGLSPDSTTNAFSSAISKLAARSAAELTAEEMLMMTGIGRHVPLRDIADYLGVTYGAARVRLHRLRERFVRLAIQYVANLEPAERREIRRFFRRAEVAVESGDATRSGHAVISAGTAAVPRTEATE